MKDGTSIIAHINPELKKSASIHQTSDLCNEENYSVKMTIQCLSLPGDKTVVLSIHAKGLQVRLKKSAGSTTPEPGRANSPKRSKTVRTFTCADPSRSRTEAPAAGVSKEACMICR